MTLDSRARRVCERLDELARCSDEEGRLTRTFLSPAFRRAQGIVSTWMEQAGLRTRVDGFANVLGEPRTTRHPVLLMGSHLDTVPGAGRFDGQLGIVLAIEAAEMVRAADLPLSVKVVAFSEEEGVRYGFPFIGSKGLCGTLTTAELDRVDAHGISVAETLRDAGYDAALHGEAFSDVAGFLEVHLEQGPVLESAGHPLGVVDAIAGQARIEVVFKGRASHAGTTPMGLRSDALAAAAVYIQQVREVGRRTHGLVATVGRLEVEPNAANVVPGRVRLVVDVRHAVESVLSGAIQEILAAAATVASAERVAWQTNVFHRQAPVPCNARLQALLLDACPRGTPVLTSGAGHDAMIMAGHVPSAMLFVRCREGISHHPAEYVSPEDIGTAVEAVGQFLHRLSSSHSKPQSLSSNPRGDAA